MRRTDNPLFFQSFVEHCYESHINPEDAYFLYKQACLGEELAKNPAMQEGFNEALLKLANLTDVFDTPTRNDIDLGGVASTLGGLMSHAIPIVNKIHNPLARAAAGALTAGAAGLGAAGVANWGANMYHGGPNASTLHLPRDLTLTGGASESSGKPLSMLEALNPSRSGDSTEKALSPLANTFKDGQARMDELKKQMVNLQGQRGKISPSAGLNDQLYYKDLTNNMRALQGQREDITDHLGSMRNDAIAAQEVGNRSISAGLRDANDAIAFREADARRFARRARETADAGPGFNGLFNRAWDGITGFNGRADRLNSELQGNYDARNYMQNKLQPALDKYVPPLPN